MFSSETLLDSWKDNENNMNYKMKQMSIEDVIIYVRIEKQNRNMERVERAKELSSKANMIEKRLRLKNMSKRHNRIITQDN